MSPRILIIGGSIGGLFAAVLLHRAGLNVTVTERSIHGLEGRGAGLVAQREVFDILREVGFEHVAHIGVVAHERIYLDRSGDIISRQHTPQTQLSWDVLFRSFRDLLPDSRYQIGRRAVEIVQEPGGVVVRYADGHKERADLVIGADGIGSVVRPAVAGRHSLPEYVGYATWRGLVPETAMPQLAANQLFERFAFFEMPGSHILGYLVAGPDGRTDAGHRRYNWVWYRRYPPAALESLLTDITGTRQPFSLAPRHVLPATIAGMRADAEKLLPPSFAAAVAAEPYPFVHAIFDYVPPRMVAGRVALMGDAAFVARPHTAMGVAKAAGDAFALRDALLATSDLKTALATYEAKRMPVDRAVVAYGQRLGQSLG
ncbi:FAD binding domain-containing protein [Ancylobacter sp. Lp-2]|uniref:FAD binding domain-containing protein n=1 Tax=Ancylobacter sp. Lp-2 TaxID=2881339 RepID=UPI001E2D0A2D|nr:FAD binding domain-containing protein [Ancylobacter sp. Lp-2]MCB4767655.1 FAD binding domain-containing protein [Ancylobacter sp. Lp-2]